MRLILISHYYPPESNAPANRAYEHARVWAKDGHDVTIVTAAPSHPLGEIYPGYRNAYSESVEGGIRIVRLPTMLAANKGIFARSLAFVSFFFSIARHRRRLPQYDAVMSTSPQFFSGLAGWLLQGDGRPWILEIRDLWPESVVAVGAMRRNIAVRILERLERWAYRRADLAVTTTQDHARHVAARAPDTPVIVIPNGITPGLIQHDRASTDALRAELGLEGRFVASYIGTHGMAHGLEVILEAAQILREDSSIHFLLAGDGATRQTIESGARERQLENISILGQQRRERVGTLWGVTDVALVLLKRSQTFESVLPSKLIEAMSLGKPVILGVDGQAKALLEEADAGLHIMPENAQELAGAVRRLANDSATALAMGLRGRAHALAHFDRKVLARKLMVEIERTVARC